VACGYPLEKTARWKIAERKQPYARPSIALLATIASRFLVRQPAVTLD
jgi:hypothetical protein